MSTLNQLILGETGCVSYIIHCSNKRECAIVDSFDGFEEDILEEIRRLGYPSVKYVIDTHTHADRKSASLYFDNEFKTGGIVKNEKTKFKGNSIKTKDGDILKIGNADVKVLYTPGHTYNDEKKKMMSKTLIGRTHRKIGHIKYLLTLRHQQNY